MQRAMAERNLNRMLIDIFPTAHHLWGDPRDAVPEWEIGGAGDELDAFLQRNRISYRKVTFRPWLAS
jgi:hypothetical protein